MDLEILFKESVLGEHFVAVAEPKVSVKASIPGGFSRFLTL
jgi:hypothetical protein